MATLNSVVRRIKTIAEAHKQIRSFFYNVNIVEWLNEKKADYPAAFLLGNGGQISPGGHATTLSFRFFFVDLVDVAEDTKSNELDIQSDMLSVAQDMISQINHPGNDWFPTGDNVFETIMEGDNDMHGGVVVDFSVRILFTQNVCAVPSDLIFVIGSGEIENTNPPPSGGGSGTEIARMPDATDASFTMEVNASIFLPDGTLSGNKTITIPVGSEGDIIQFFNNETGFVWLLSGSPIYLSDGDTAITQLDADTNYDIEFISGKWRIDN